MSATARGAFTARSRWSLTGDQQTAAEEVQEEEAQLEEVLVEEARLITCTTCTGRTKRSATGPQRRGAGYGGGQSR